MTSRYLAFASQHMTTGNRPVYLLPPSEIMPHEHIDNKHGERLGQRMRELGFFTLPILVEHRDLILLDGHHRLWALLNIIGASRVPATLIDYDDDSLVSVASWRKDVVVNRDIVRQAALSRRLMQPKTSRHVLSVDTGEVMIPLSELISDAENRHIKR